VRLQWRWRFWGARRQKPPFTLAFNGLGPVQISDRGDDALPDVKFFKFAERKSSLPSASNASARLAAIRLASSHCSRLIVFFQQRLEARIAAQVVGVGVSAGALRTLCGVARGKIGVQSRHLVIA
jgi:hypothetical protein